ncbi:copper amine oxidase N-terminal domain-containing protein [Dehalobacterium formicoaceticum]|uniref:Copper amine oxidase N-terminal domain-containing protein n=1 Tax=Dehalobacterium formicoaceticum TaxID=51515 RepID=A0ABT1Y3K9_9FIRM|nr:stalk domain-containing protein [Dehalobacterium formicoaceticum]MCR6545465.1 copper amine oxidase N-terminal domain-containing protein [Dehalobacterium formicoaceticum]
MIKNKKKVIALVVSALILFMSFSTTSFAASIQTTLKAQFVSFKILLNGQQVTPKDSAGNIVQPLLVNNTTYLPLRAFGDLFNKNVDWNNTLKQISITDKPNNEVEGLKSQIKDKDNQILLLNSQLTAANNKITDLEKKKDTKSNDIDDIIADMEDSLNDDYDDKNFGRDYLNNKSVLFDAINLDGDEDDLELELKIDLEDFYAEKYDWYDDIDQGDIEDLLQEICDAIWDDRDLEDADIDGTIYDTSEREELESFSVKAGKSLKLD